MNNNSDDSRPLINSENENNDEIEPETEIRNPTSRPSVGEWICIIVKNITLEPCILIYFMASSMEGPLYTTLMQEKVCLINFNYSSEICNNISSYKEKQIIVEQKANQLLMINNIISSIPSVLFALFLGSWSDKYGRKIPLILPYFGNSLKAIIILLNCVYWALPTEYLLISAVPSAFTGGMTCLFMSMYSYLTDISDKKSRTTRLAFFDTFLIIGPPFGLLLGNLIYKHLGYNGIYSITCGLYIVCIIYITVYIKETRGINAYHDTCQELVPKINTRLRDLFHLGHVKETFLVTFKKRVNYDRAKIVLLLVSVCLLVFQFSGYSIEILYTQLKFDWTLEDYIYFLAGSIGFDFIGMAIIFPILSYKFSIRDEVLAIFGVFTGLLKSMIKAFANQSYQLYIGSAVGLLSGIPLVITRSMISKILPKDAVGKAFSVLGSWESVIPLIAAPLYSLTYNATISVFPGMFQIVNFGFYFLAALIYGVICWLNNRVVQNEVPLVTEQVDEE